MIFRKSKMEKKSVKLIDELFCGSFLNFSGPLCIILIHNYILVCIMTAIAQQYTTTCVYENKKKCQQLFHHINIIKKPSLIPFLEK